MKINLEILSREAYRADFILQKENAERLAESFAIPREGIRCRFEIKRNFDKFFFKGFLEGEVSRPCDFCLEKASLKVDDEFELIFVPAENLPDQSSTDGEIFLPDADYEMLEGSELDAAKYFEEQILLEAPFVLLCKKSCKGLCSHCGSNLNLETCECASKASESKHPFSVIKSLINSKQA